MAEFLSYQNKRASLWTMICLTLVAICIQSCEPADTSNLSLKDITHDHSGGQMPSISEIPIHEIQKYAHITSQPMQTNIIWQHDTPLSPLNLQPDLQAPLGLPPYPKSMTWRHLVKLLTPEEMDLELAATPFNSYLDEYDWLKAKQTLDAEFPNEQTLKMRLIWANTKLSHLNQIWRQLSSISEIEDTLDYGKKALEALANHDHNDPVMFINQLIFLRYANEYKKTLGRQQLFTHTRENMDDLDPELTAPFLQSQKIDDSILTMSENLIINILQSEQTIDRNTHSHLRLQVALYIMSDILETTQSWIRLEETIHNLLQFVEMQDQTTITDDGEEITESKLKVPSDFYPFLLRMWLKSPRDDFDPYAKEEITDQLLWRMKQNSANAIDTLLIQAEIARTNNFNERAVYLYQRILNRESDNLKATLKITKHWLSNHLPLTAHTSINQYPSPTESDELQLLEALTLIQLGQSENAINLVNEMNIAIWYPHLLEHRAHIATGIGQWTEAGQTLQFLLYRRPENSSLIRKMTHLYTLINQKTEAIATLNRLKYIATQEETLQTIYELLNQFNSEEEKENTHIEQQYQLATNHPHDVQAILNYANILIDQGALDEALSWLNLKCDRYNQYSEVHLLAAEIYLLKAQHLFAFQEIESAITLHKNGKSLLPGDMQVLSRLMQKGEHEPSKSHHTTVLHEHFWQTLKQESPSRLMTLLLHYYAIQEESQNSYELALALLLKLHPDNPYTYRLWLAYLDFSPSIDEAELLSLLTNLGADEMATPLRAVLEIRRGKQAFAESLFKQAFQALVSRNSETALKYIKLSLSFKHDLKPLKIDYKSLFNEIIQSGENTYAAEFHLAYDDHFWKKAKTSTRLSALIQFAKRLPPTVILEDNTIIDLYGTLRNTLLVNLQKAGKWRESIYFANAWIKNIQREVQTEYIQNNYYIYEGDRAPAQLWIHLCNAYLRLGMTEAAVNKCQMALSEYPAHSELQTILFKSHLQRKDYASAERSLNQYKSNIEAQTADVNSDNDSQSETQNHINSLYNELYRTVGLAHKIIKNESPGRISSPHQHNYTIKKLSIAYSDLLNNRLAKAYTNINSLLNDSYTRHSVAKAIQSNRWPTRRHVKDNPPFFQLIHHHLPDVPGETVKLREQWLTQGIETYRLFRNWDEVRKRLEILRTLRRSTSIEFNLIEDNDLPEAAAINKPFSMPTAISIEVLKLADLLLNDEDIFNHYQSPLNDLDPDIKLNYKESVWLQLLANVSTLQDIKLNLIPQGIRPKFDTSTPAFSALSQWPDQPTGSIVNASKKIKDRTIFSQDFAQSFQQLQTRAISDRQKKNIFAHWITAYVSLKCNLPELSEQICHKLISENHESAVIYNLLCEARLQQNKSLGHLKTRALPETSSIHLYLKARKAATLGQHQKAAQTFITLLKQEDGNAHLQFALAQQWIEEDEKEKTFRIFQTLMSKSSPYRHLATYRYVHDQLQTGNKDLPALSRVLEKALKSFPGDPLLLEMQGRIYYYKHNYVKALVTLLEALPKLKERTRIHYYLGEVYWALGNSNRRIWAMRHLEQASRTLVLNPDSAAARDLIVTIKQASQN